MSGTLSIPTDALDKGATKVPIRAFESPGDLTFSPNLGASRYRVRLDDRGTLDALLVNKGSRELVVVFHGAMVKGHHHLPRFEWLRTLDERTDYSCLFLSDPTLTLDPALLLGWYLGWDRMNLYPLLAETAKKATEATGAEKIILAGSSGGGYAALQVSPHLPGSLAIPFNAQTAINRYHWNAQISYLRRIMPHLEPQEKAARQHWGRPLGHRVSAIGRYQQACDNYVLYVQNVRDQHHYQKHYLPFVAMATKSPNAERILFEEYSAAPFHEPPGRGRFVDTIRRGSAMLDEWTA